MVRLMIADEHPSYLQTLQHILHEEPDLQHIKLISTLEEAAHALTAVENSIDVLLFSLQNRSGNPVGLYYAQYIRQQFPEIKLIAYSSYRSGFLVHQMQEIGVEGFLFKNTAISLLLQTIQEVRKGNSYYTPDALALCNRYLLCINPPPNQPLNRIENRLLGYLFETHSLEEIAQKMNRSLCSVEMQLQYLIHKYKASSIQHLLSKIEMSGLLASALFFFVTFFQF